MTDTSWARRGELGEDVAGGRDNRVSRTTTATPADVWAVLADGFSYAAWVVGTSRVRAVDPNWPAAGSRIHHSFGPWPAVISDVTLAQECLPKSRLVLEPHGGPLGAARVVITLEPRASGCEVSIDEDAIEGVGRWLVPPGLRRQLVRARNVETLLRLTLIAERRTDPDLPNGP
jgi:hypothetical protein